MVQELVPKHMMGSVFSLDTSISQGSLAISIAVTGPVVGWIGPGRSLMVGGVLSAASIAFAMTRRGALDPDRVPRRSA
jgi:hypothetical protein